RLGPPPHARAGGGRITRDDQWLADQPSWSIFHAPSARRGAGHSCASCAPATGSGSRGGKHGASVRSGGGGDRHHVGGGVSVSRGGLERGGGRFTPGWGPPRPTGVRAAEGIWERRRSRGRP